MSQRAQEKLGNPFKKVVAMLRKTSVGAIVGLTVTLGTVMGSAVAASAQESNLARYPVGCTTAITSTGTAVTAYCSGGTGEYRPKGTCRRNSTGAQTTIYGIWVKPGAGQPYASCPSGYTAIKADVVFRA